MRYLLLLLCLVGIDAAADPLSPDWQAEMLAAHNRWRAEVGVQSLTWADDLANTASRWAQTLKTRRNCQMEHSVAGQLGENLYWASPWRHSDGKRQVQRIAASHPVDSWAGERAAYDSRSNRCAPGRVCGHYTQVVWQDTREVGCGRAVCDDASQVWVCNYRPAGNIVGRRPY